MAGVCGAAVGVAMAAGAPLLVSVANTPPEVCWSPQASWGTLLDASMLLRGAACGGQVSVRARTFVALTSPNMLRTSGTPEKTVMTATSRTLKPQYFAQIISGSVQRHEVSQ